MWSHREEEKGEVEVVHMLLPGEAQMYTWDKPNGVRKLKWGVAEEGGVEYTPLRLKVRDIPVSFFINQLILLIFN